MDSQYNYNYQSSFSHSSNFLLCFLLNFDWLSTMCNTAFSRDEQQCSTEGEIHMRKSVPYLHAYKKVIT